MKHRFTHGVDVYKGIGDNRPMPFNFPVFLEGLGTGAGLIVAIGAQNAFVLRQGIKKRYVFATALTCTLVDVVLITAGVMGLGVVIEQSKILLYVAGAAGAVFLVFYGLRSFIAALRPQSLDSTDKNAGREAGLGKTVAAVLALSLLNPHVYLDTVVLLGSIGGRHELYDRFAFITGASSASLVWFFGLAYGAGYLTPLFKRPLTWKILDFAIAAVMWLIAVQLVFFVFREAQA